MTFDSAPAEGPIDLHGALARLDGDVDLYRELYPMFCQDTGLMLEQITQLLAESRRGEAARVLHKLKGLASTMGASALAGAALAAESAMLDAPSRQDEILCAAVHAAFAQGCRALENELPALRGTAG